MITCDPEGYYTASDPADFDDWEVLLVEDWKPGVKRLHCRRAVYGGIPVAKSWWRHWGGEWEFRLIYCEAAVAPGVGDGA